MRTPLFSFTKEGISNAFSEIAKRITYLERKGDTDDLAPKRLVLPRDKPLNPVDGQVRFTGTKIEVYSNSVKNWVEV